MGCCKFKMSLRAKQAYDILKLILYTVDIATDGYASYCYYQLGDTFWATMTLGLIFPAMVFTSIYCMMQRTKKTNKEKRSVLLLVSICFSPFITLYFMIDAVVRSLAGDKKTQLGFIKLTESVLESWPQSCLQMYILFIYLEDESKIVGAWQIFTLTISLLSLTLSISSYHLFENSSKIVRVSFLLFGSLALVTRLLISCIFSMAIKTLWLVPMGTYIAVAFFVWQVKKIGKCSESCKCQPLNPTEHACKLVNIPNFPISIIVTAVFNNFSRSGLLIGTVALGYSIGGYFLVPGRTSIVTLTLAVLSVCVNILLLAIPQFQVIGETWISNNQGDQALLPLLPGKADETHQPLPANQSEKTDQTLESDQADHTGNIFY